MAETALMGTRELRSRELFFIEENDDAMAKSNS